MKKLSGNRGNTPLIDKGSVRMCMCVVCVRVCACVTMGVCVHTLICMWLQYVHVRGLTTPPLLSGGRGVKTPGCLFSPSQHLALWSVCEHMKSLVPPPAGPLPAWSTLMWSHKGQGGRASPPWRRITTRAPEQIAQCLLMSLDLFMAGDFYPFQRTPNFKVPPVTPFLLSPFSLFPPHGTT